MTQFSENNEGRRDGTFDASDIIGQAPAINECRHETSFDPAGSVDRLDGSSTRSSLNAAIRAADAQAKAKDRYRPRRQFAARSTRMVILRIAFAVIAANLFGFGIATWSRAEDRRFPEISSVARHFPVRGKCSPTEFCVLMTGAMGMAAAAGYGIAAALQSVVDS